MKQALTLLTVLPLAPLAAFFAERVRNRSFEDDKKQAQAWALVRSGGSAGTIVLVESQPLNPRNQ